MTIEKINKSIENFQELYNGFVVLFHELMKEDKNDLNNQIITNKTDYLWDVYHRIRSAIYEMVGKNTDNLDILKQLSDLHSILYRIGGDLCDLVKTDNMKSSGALLRSSVMQFDELLKKSVTKEKKKTAKQLKKMTHKQKTVSDEIRHLIRNKGYTQDRAVAAALSMKREGKLKKSFIDYFIESSK